MNQADNYIMPDSGGDVFCASVSSRITVDSYQNIFLSNISNIIKEYGHAKVLLYYPSGFPGWDLDAAGRDIESMTNLGKYLKKVALVNPPQKSIQRWTLMRPLVGGEFKTFASDELDKALNWIKS